MNNTLRPEQILFLANRELLADQTMRHYDWTRARRILAHALAFVVGI